MTSLLDEVVNNDFELSPNGDVLVAKSFPHLCDPMDPAGSSAHGFSQARILE